MSHVHVHRETTHGKVCAKGDKLCIATVWYIASVVVFILVAVTAALAGEVKRAQEVNKIDRPVYEIASQFVNPAPSVRLFVTSAPWCLPCKRLHPVLEDLQEKGYEIKVEELDRPNKPGVPYLEFYQFGELSEEFTGIPRGEDPKAFIIRKFEEIEGTIFTPRGQIR